MLCATEGDVIVRFWFGAAWEVVGNVALAVAGRNELGKADAAGADWKSEKLSTSGVLVGNVEAGTGVAADGVGVIPKISSKLVATGVAAV